MMKFSLVLVILISFLAISVFGFIGLGEMHKQMGGNCPGSVSQGVTCPVKDGIFAFAVFHVKALQGLSQSGFLDVSPIFLLTVLLLAFALSLIVSASSSELFQNQSYFKKNYEYKIRDVGSETISWLAHLEHSPSFAKGA
ncbi:hypothetical protein D4R51_01165 [bacterium]|nr:MAG: hypothetical protein D4R51_01165 [bacterium]